MEKWSRGGAEGREREVKERVGEGEEKTSNEAHVCGWRCGWGGGGGEYTYFPVLYCSLV